MSAAAFPSLPIGELCRVQSGFAFKSTDWRGEGQPVIRIGNVRPGFLELADCVYVTDAVAAKAKDFRLRDGDIVISMTGYIGVVARVLGSSTPLLNQRVGRFRDFRRDKIDPDYLYLALRDETVRKKIELLGHGAAQPNISPSAIQSVEIPVPDLIIQRRIASIVGAYDSAIEVNRRRVAGLEAMARGLFEEWFVRFRFPGHESHSITDTPDGRLPDGWRYQHVDDAFDMTGGGTPSKAEPKYWEGGAVNWFTPSDLTGSKSLFMDASETRITDEGLRRSSAKLFPPDCVMMTSRATLGVIAINTTEATTNQGFITCFPNDLVPRTYLYYWLVQNVPVFIGHATGATFKEITKGVFKRLPFLTPEAAIVARFERLAKPLHDNVLALERSNRSLASARDLLLPRLISGELSVAVAERELEAAA